MTVWFLDVWLLLAPSDIRITCLYSEDCVLPCLFTPAGGAVVHWYGPGNSLLVSSNQSAPHDQNFVNKVAMFQNQVALGNGSLILQHCQPQDRGRYRCHVTGQQKIPDTTIIVRVEGKFLKI